MADEETKMTVSGDFKEAVKNIRTRLSLYGITIEEYVKTGGNLTGSLFIPSQLAILNASLKIEDAFYFVANKVFIACDTFCFGIPGQFEYNGKEVVGKHVFYTFQSAIFEEINQRFLSNSFPEFQNAQTIVPANMTIQSTNQAGGFDVRDYLNAITKQKLLAINGREIDPKKQYDPELMKDKDLLFNNMSNLDMPPSTSKHFLLAKEDGRFYQVSEETIATSASVKVLKSELEKSKSQVASLLSDVNALNRHVSELMDSEAILPRKIEDWNPNTQYKVYDYVFYQEGIYIALHNSQNQVPTKNNPFYGKIVNQVYRANGGDLVYQPGTDVKFSLTNPNARNYISLKIFQTDESTQTVSYLFLKICDELKRVTSQQTVDFKINEAIDLINGLCDLTLTPKDKDKNIKNDIDKMLTAFCCAYGWRYQNEVLLFANSSLESTLQTHSANFGAEDNYLRVSHSQVHTGGNNMIEQKNLPKVSFNTLHKHNVNGTTNNAVVNMNDFNLCFKFVSYARDGIKIGAGFSYSHANAGDRYPFFVLNYADDGGGGASSAAESVEGRRVSDSSYVTKWETSEISHSHEFHAQTDSVGSNLQLNPNKQTEFTPKYQQVITRTITSPAPPELLAKLGVNFRSIHAQKNDVTELPSGYPTIATIKDKILPEFFNEKLSIVRPNELLYVNDADHKVFMSVSDLDIPAVKNTVQEFQKLNKSPEPSEPTQDGIATTSFVNTSLNPEKGTEEMIQTLANRLARYLHD